MASHNNGSWLRYVKRHYDAMEPKRALARRHYQTRIQEIREQDLIQRTQGESNAQFKERKATSDYFPAFATVVDSYVGQLQQGNITRMWTDADEEGGISDGVRDQLLDDTDGDGTNWGSMRSEVAATLISEHMVWGLVEGPVFNDQNQQIAGPYVRPISPEAVMDWGRDQEGLEWVKVKHKVSKRDGPTEKDEPVERWRIYWRDGYEDWEERQSGKGDRIAIMVSDGRQPYGQTPEGEDNGFRYYNRSGGRALPIFPVELPLKRFVGYVLAHKNKHLFNKESERDNLLRIANTPKGVFVGNESDFKKMADRNRHGDNLWFLRPEARNTHYFMAPDTDPTQVASEVLLQKIEAFFVSAFQSYEDATQSSPKTATEIIQDASRGEWSFLNNVATSVDEFENEAMWRLEQIEHPGEEELWGQAGTSTEKNFQPINAQDRAAELLRRYFGRDSLPVGESTQVDAARQILELDGVAFDEEELEDAVLERRRKRQRERQLAAGMEAETGVELG